MRSKFSEHEVYDFNSVWCFMFYEKFCHFNIVLFSLSFVSVSESGCEFCRNVEISTQKSNSPVPFIANSTVL